jgi:hypothetical protein
MRRTLAVVVVGLLLASCTSCGRDAKQREVVRGRVLFQGDALPGGTIVFTPDTDLGGDGPMAVAEIKSDGSYALKTGNDFGASSGPYRVTIAAAAPVAPVASAQAVVLPRKYRDPAQSGLKREIKPGP